AAPARAGSRQVRHLMPRSPSQPHQRPGVSPVSIARKSSVAGLAATRSQPRSLSRSQASRDPSPNRSTKPMHLTSGGASSSSTAAPSREKPLRLGSSQDLQPPPSNELQRHGRLKEQREVRQQLQASPKAAVITREDRARLAQAAAGARARPQVAAPPAGPGGGTLQGDRRTKTQDKSVAELWQKLEELQAEAQRERGEKEELRKSNEKLQLRLDALSKQIGVQPIKAPSPPKSLTSSFRQVASDRRDGSETAPTPLTALASHVSEVQRSLPVAFQPQVRQSLPSQPYRQPSRVEI
ncbi:unnamed protein product, partial [Polarella glacialis]